MQYSLFDIEPSLPQGFRYQPDFLTEQREAELLNEFPRLPFREFQWHGYTGKRRTVTFGWSYSFDNGQLAPADPLPDFLQQLKRDVAEWAGLNPGLLVQGLVTEYQPGAGIGWHRDAPPFGIVLGVSLKADCRFQLRLEGKGEKREIAVARRSVYALTGKARTVWQHSIPQAKEERFSITFRTLRETR